MRADHFPARFLPVYGCWTKPVVNSEPDQRPARTLLSWYEMIVLRARLSPG
jgi:hypothetical protein